ncbi:Drought induced 19/ RING finger protein 114 [Cynara cardunculus var. scolymus]|uniref:Drought induced 19/ RING finger protein 114 n=1 Tax=Cynara cardunculus var. scolymus TaxID=59895 RepID=A0A103Y3C0_CYNCS|nr:Drought induced 19/ RING finger protein 114 [Cynara cardunculus var. scolymus]
MDADSWIARLSSTSRRYQHALQSRSSDTFMGFEDIEVDDDIREEIQCSFCGGYFDITCLCCHISEEHPVEAKNGICPVCAMRVGVDMVAHIALHHGNIFKMNSLTNTYMQQKRKSCRGGSISMLSLLRRELREGNLQSNSGGSSYIVSSANAAPDPLLSSFISPMGDDLVINSSKSLVEPTVVKKSTIKNLPHRYYTVYLF